MFDNIIGYEAEKEELARFCDIIKHPEYYKQFNVKIPKGILLYGDPGIGKTTFSKAVMEECGRPYQILRKNGETGEFIQTMNATFEKAKETAPSIILLDDVDKFGDGNPFSQEYTSLQGIMDDYRDYDIFIIATANEMYKLPQSLRRAGRFDRVINISSPTKKDSENITKYYFSDKQISPTVNMDTVAHILQGYSCATLESVINMAGMYAAYDRRSMIEMSDIIESIFAIVYDMPKSNNDRTEFQEQLVAIHEAGHAVIAEVLTPGSLAFVTIRDSENRSKISTRTDNGPTNIYEYYIRAMITMGGKAAVELKYNIPDDLSNYEMKDAMSLMDQAIKDLGSNGLSNLRSYDSYGDSGSDAQLTTGTIESLYNKDLEILRHNWNLVESIAAELIVRETLVADDIARIKQQINYGGHFCNLINGPSIPQFNIANIVTV